MISKSRFNCLLNLWRIRPKLMSDVLQIIYMLHVWHPTRLTAPTGMSIAPCCHRSSAAHICQDIEPKSAASIPNSHLCATLYNLRCFLGHGVYRRQDVATRDKRKNAGVHNVNILSPVHNQLWIHSPAFLPGPHGSGAAAVVRAGGGIENVALGISQVCKPEGIRMIAPAVWP